MGAIPRQIYKRNSQPIVIDLSSSEYKTLKKVADLRCINVTRLVYDLIKEYIIDLDDLEDLRR